MILILLLLLNLLCMPSQVNANWICYKPLANDNFRYRFSYKMPDYQELGEVCYSLEDSQAQNGQATLILQNYIPRIPALSLPKDKNVTITITGDQKGVNANLSRIFDVIPNHLPYIFCFEDILIEPIFEDLLMFQKLLCKKITFHLIEKSYEGFFNQQKSLKKLLSISGKDCKNEWTIEWNSWRNMAYHFFCQGKLLTNLEYVARLPFGNKIIFCTKGILLQVKGKIPTQILIVLGALARIRKLRLILEVTDDSHLEERYCAILNQMVGFRLLLKIDHIMLGHENIICGLELGGGFNIKMRSDFSQTLLRIFKGKSRYIRGILIIDENQNDKSDHCGSKVFDRVKKIFNFCPRLKILNITLKDYRYLGCLSPFEALRYVKNIPVNPEMEEFHLIFDQNSVKKDRKISQYRVFQFEALMTMLLKKFPKLEKLQIGIGEQSSKGTGVTREDVLDMLLAFRRNPLKNLKNLNIVMPYFSQNALFDSFSATLSTLEETCPYLEHLTLKFNREEMTDLFSDYNLKKRFKFLKSCKLNETEMKFK